MGEKPLERPRRRWENSIKTDLQEVESGERWHGLDLSGSGEVQVAGACEGGNELWGIIK